MKPTKSLTVRLSPDLWKLWDEYCKLKNLPKRVAMSNHIEALRQEVEEMRSRKQK